MAAVGHGRRGKGAVTCVKVSGVKATAMETDKTKVTEVATDGPLATFTAEVVKHGDPPTIAIGRDNATIEKVPSNTKDGVTARNVGYPNAETNTDDSERSVIKKEPKCDNTTGHKTLIGVRANSSVEGRSANSVVGDGYFVETTDTSPVS